ncbi:hypothetical protein [Streptomyces sp. NPDC088725]|uniref:hypothetical protein n=1 Tax=Streptomyces sp. NPDC088725 TaxID=3365873 RepID=UPI0038200A65
MLDTTPLTDAVDRLSDRLRGAPQSRLQRGVAAEALALARELSVRAQRLEGAGGEGCQELRIMPDLGVFAVADQLAVAAGDLAEALRTAPSAVELDEAVGSVERVAATARL